MSLPPSAFDAPHGPPARLAVASGDGRVALWDARSGARVAQLGTPDHLAHSVTCVAVSSPADGAAQPRKKRKKSGAKGKERAARACVAAGTKAGLVLVWDAASGELMHRLDGHAQAVRDVAFSPCGARLFSCGDDRRVVEWDAEGGEEKASFAASKRAPVTRLAVRHDGAALLTAGQGIKLWDLATGRVLQKYAGHTSPVGCLAFAPDGKAFVSGAADRFLHVWDADRRGKEARRPAAALALDFRPVAARLAAAEAGAGAGGAGGAGGAAEYTVAAVSEAGTAGVWRWDRSEPDTALESRAPACRVTVRVPAAAGKKRGSVRATAQDGALVNAQVLADDRVLVVRGSGLRPAFEEVSLADKRADGGGALRASVELPSLSARLFENAAGAAGKKRKGAPAGSVHVVGAEQAGAGHVRKARHAAMLEDPEAVARAARAAVPANGLGGGGSSTGEEVAAAVAAAGATPAAGSLQVVLSQALKTSDEGMIEQCIGTHSADVIRRTVDRLPTRDIVPFLRRLVAKFQTKPSRGPHLLMWIQEILTRHCSFLTSVPGLAHELSGLFQTVDARLSVFKKLLSLSGRLDLMLTQINVRQDAAAAAAAAASEAQAGPLATYEEGSDGGESEDGEEGDDDDDEDEEDDGGNEDGEDDDEDDEDMSN